MVAEVVAEGGRCPRCTHARSAHMASTSHPIETTFRWWSQIKTSLEMFLEDPTDPRAADLRAHIESYQYAVRQGQLTLPRVIHRNPAPPRGPRQ